MINNKEMLESMVKTTRMGQTGLRAVLRSKMEPELKSALTEQLRLYDDLEDEAQALASGRGWKLRKPDSMLQNMIEHMTLLKLGKKDHSSRIADMIIQGNTQGMISSLRDQHAYEGEDCQVLRLSRKLLACETENICQMKPFL